MPEYKARHIDDNLVPNGNLEQNSIANPGTAYGFETFYSTTGAEPVFTLDTSDSAADYETRPIEGKHMQKIDGNGSTIVDSGIRTQFNLPITSGSTFQFRFYGKANATTGYIFGRVTWYTGQGTTISSVDTGSIYGKTDWTLKSTTLTAPTTTVATHAKLSVLTGSVTNGMFWIDQLYFREDSKVYITSAEMLTLAGVEVGTGKEFSTDEFNSAVAIASRLMERDSGRRWYSSDEYYKIIQKAVAHLTASTIKASHYGDIPSPALKNEDNKEDWHQTQYTYYLSKAVGGKSIVYLSHMTFGNPYI